MSDHHDDSAVIPTLLESAFDIPFDNPAEKPVTTYFTAPQIDLSIYSRIVVCMSGGKDSLACLLHILELGACKSKIELWHHDVDGREGSHLMDWTFMEDYNRCIASEFEVPLREGFEGELLKVNSISQPHLFESPEGLITLKRDLLRCRLGTRRKFPQVAASLQTRWC